MRFCQPHWDKLRDAIKERGLDSLVAKDGAEAMQSLMQGRPDPLLAAHNSILGNLIEKVGLVVMAQNDDGSERCPLCFAKEVAFSHPCQCGDPNCTPEVVAAMFEGWIDRAADDELERMGGKRGAS